MTLRNGVLLFGCSALILSACLIFRPPTTVRPANIPPEPGLVNSPQPASQGPQTKTFSIFLIALEDAGKSGPKVGCGDSLVAVDVQTKDISSALQMLLDHHSRYYGQSGLYNALYQSNLTINRFKSTAGKVEVDLTGNLTLGGVCDNPRVIDQLTATIRQATDSNSPVIIKVNGMLLEDLFSQK